MSDRIQSGIYFDMDESTYRAAPGFSQSAVKRFLESPMLYRKSLSEPPAPETDAVRMGRLFDCYLLDKKRLSSDWIDDGGREYRKDVDKTWRKQAIDDGYSIYSPDDLKLCEQMSKAVWAHQEAVKLLARAKFQVSVFADYAFSDGFTIPIKGRFDVLPSFFDAIVDVKKTKDASPSGFGKEIYNYGHHIQGAWYPMLWNLINGVEDHRENFGLIAVQEDAFVDDRGEVHGVGVYSIKPELMDLGKDIVSRGMEKYRYCLETDKWPGVSQELQWVDIPKWAYRQEEAA